MEELSVIETIRTVGAEFEEVTDDEIELWIRIYSPMVSKKQFGKLYNLALAYLICHKLKMADKGTSAEDGLGGSIATQFSVGSISDGGTSISYTGAAGNALTTDSEYALTIYGMQYLQVRRMAIVPIRITGGM